jgi:hypothetical protein
VLENVSKREKSERRGERIDGLVEVSEGKVGEVGREWPKWVIEIS